MRRSTARGVGRLATVFVITAATLATGPARGAGGEPEIVVRLALTDTSGTPVTQVTKDEHVVLKAFVEDVRPAASGVFAAYLDVNYSGGVSVAGAITPGITFPNGTSGSTSTPGLLDDVGSFAGFTPTGAGELLLFSVEFSADDIGDVTFQSSAADQTTAHAILVFGSDAAITDVTFGEARLSVVDERPPPAPIASYLLPKKARLRMDPRPGTNARLTVAGYLDTGPTPFDPAADALLQIGRTDFPAAGLTRKGRRAFRLTGPGVDLVITPPRTGSSRAKFKLSFTETATSELDEDVPIRLRFTSGNVDATAVFEVRDGKFLLGRERGTLTAPALYLLAAKGKLAGAGRDSLKLVAGLNSISGAPDAAPSVTVALGDTFSASVAGDAFTRKGSRNVFVHRAAGPGITSLVLDFDRRTLRLRAAGIDLGALPEGAQPLLLTISAGERWTVPVRMVRKGKKLTY